MRKRQKCSDHRFCPSHREPTGFRKRVVLMLIGYRSDTVLEQFARLCCGHNHNNSADTMKNVNKHKEIKMSHTDLLMLFPLIHHATATVQSV